MCEFIKQVLINFLGTISGGFVIYFFLEKRFIDTKNRESVKNELKNLLGETVRNVVVVERILEAKEKILTTDQFPISRLHVRATTNFLYKRPIQNNRKFYLELNGLLSNMESVNSLISLVFSQKDEKSILTNKKEIVSISPKLLEKMNKVLEKLVEFNGEYKFNDESEV